MYIIYSSKGLETDLYFFYLFVYLGDKTVEVVIVFLNLLRSRIRLESLAKLVEIKLDNIGVLSAIAIRILAIGLLRDRLL